MINEELAAAADRLWGEGNYSQALSLYQRIFSEAPGDIKALCVYANALISCRQASQALSLIESFNRSSDLANVDLASIKAKALLAVGDSAQSLDLFHQLVNSYPNWADGWNDYACALLHLGRDSEAVPCFEKALSIEATHRKACLGLAKLYKKKNQMQQAKKTLLKCIDLPKNEEIRRELIPILLRLDENEEALKHCQLLTQSDSAIVDDYMLQARALFNMGRINDYVDYLSSLSFDSWKGVSLKSIAIGALAESGHADKTKELLKQHLEKAPSDANARLIEAREALRTGDLEKGWKSYAYRLNLPANQVHYDLTPTWAGEPVHNGHILVLGEQGVGDICYFSRFLDPLLKENPDTALIVEPRMVPLLEASFPKLYVFSDPKDISFLPSPLRKIPLGSLPLLYGKSNQEVASRFRPLQVPTTALQHLRDRIEADSLYSYRIGISLTAGRPGDEYQRRKRSLPIHEVLKQFSDLPVTLINLEHNVNVSEFNAAAEHYGLQVLQYADLTQDLRLLSAAIATVDLVVTAQQTNAHLCGALNKHGIVMLPPGCHFVYGTTNRSTWYPSLELIRTSDWGEWSQACHTLHDRLHQILAV